MQHFEIRALALTSRLLVAVCLLFATAAIAFSQTPQVSIKDLTLTEGDDPQVCLASEEVEITLSATSTNDVTVTVSTQAGTAQSDVDFASGSANVTIPAGTTSKKLPLVCARGDTLVEGNENFFLNLSNPINATLADDHQAEVTIVDDDALILLAQPNTQRAAALDSVLFTKETLPIVNNLNFSSDSRTRIIVFAVGWKGSAITDATAEDPQGTVFHLTPEFVDKLAVGNTPKALSWLSQIVLKMPEPNQIPAQEDLKIRISSGQTSNFVLVNVKPQ